MELFDGDNFTGQCVEVCEDCPFLQARGLTKDRISSIKVYGDGAYVSLRQTNSVFKKTVFTFSARAFFSISLNRVDWLGFKTARLLTQLGAVRGAQLPRPHVHRGEGKLLLPRGVAGGEPKHPVGPPGGQLLLRRRARRQRFTVD